MLRHTETSCYAPGRLEEPKNIANVLLRHCDDVRLAGRFRLHRGPAGKSTIIARQ